MKSLILIVLLTFIVVGGATMFLTGTFKAIMNPAPPPPQAGDETEQAAGTTAEGGDAEPQEGAQEGAAAATSFEETQAKLELADYKTQIAAADEKLEDYKNRISEAKTQLATIRTETLALNSIVSFASRIEKLAKLYEKMKPDNAAEILSGLDASLSMKIINEMSSKSSGKLMDALATKDPKYLITISKLMTAADKPGDQQALTSTASKKTTTNN